VTTVLETRLAAISAVHFAVAPGVVVGLIPWAMTGWDMQTPPSSSPALRVLGAAMIAAAVAVLVRLFVRFVTDGLGTPAPVVPTRHLVVTGLYRHVRNPMYIAVVAAIVGQALVLGRPGLLLYAAAVWLTVAAFVRWYEEPALQQRFAASYDEYRVAVPAWWPRLHSWTPARRIDAP
jgi:protein-S-isoprenylcysteine O-methyltransferase Ste14